MFGVIATGEAAKQLNISANNWNRFYNYLGVHEEQFDQKSRDTILLNYFKFICLFGMFWYI